MIARWLARALRPALLLYAARHEPTQIITNATEANIPYLRRWKLINSTWWHPGIYIHNMLRDDDAAKHNHPYVSISIALTDGLIEFYELDPSKGLGWGKLPRTIHEGQIIYRSRTFAHQLTLEPGKEAWTLFIPFFRSSEPWGFWCPKGFKDFVSYHRDRRAAMLEGKTGTLLGCGEEIKCQAELDAMELYNADPNCKHHVEVQWSGVKCIKCHGWYCI